MSCSSFVCVYLRDKGRVDELWLHSERMHSMAVELRCEYFEHAGSKLHLVSRCVCHHDVERGSRVARGQGPAVELVHIQDRRHAEDDAAQVVSADGLWQAHQQDEGEAVHHFDFCGQQRHADDDEDDVVPEQLVRLYPFELVAVCCIGVACLNSLCNKPADPALHCKQHTQQNVPQKCQHNRSL